MARISLCMIVKDEEAMLADCLASARGGVDEMIVVDTGSKDATKSLARAAGARVFDFVWCNDFAAARNEALRHALGDWVLVLDADERIAAGSAPRLRSAVKRAKFDVGLLPLHNAARLDASVAEVLSGAAREGEINYVPRLLRNTDGLVYGDPVHENVTAWLQRRGTRVNGIDVPIVHFGATKEVVDARNKIERNRTLLAVRIDRNPADFEAYGYLAHECLRAGAVDEGYDVAARGWQHVARSQDFSAVHRLATVRSHLQIMRKEYAEGRETLRVARSFGENPDFPFLRAYAFESEALHVADTAERRKLLELARDGYRECMRLAGMAFINIFANGCTTWYGATRLGTTELQLSDAAGALRSFEAALRFRSEYEPARLGKAEATLDCGDALGALFQLEPLLKESLDAWVLAAAAAEKLGRGSDLRLLTRRAMALLPKGFVGAHRRERLRGLVSRLRISVAADERLTELAPT